MLQTCPALLRSGHYSAWWGSLQIRISSITSSQPDLLEPKIVKLQIKKDGWWFSHLSINLLECGVQCRLYGGMVARLCPGCMWCPIIWQIENDGCKRRAVPCRARHHCTTVTHQAESDIKWRSMFKCFFLFLANKNHLTSIYFWTLNCEQKKAVSVFPSVADQGVGRREDGSAFLRFIVYLLGG